MVAKQHGLGEWCWQGGSISAKNWHSKLNTEIVPVNPYKSWCRQRTQSSLCQQSSSKYLEFPKPENTHSHTTCRYTYLIVLVTHVCVCANLIVGIHLLNKTTYNHNIYLGISRRRIYIYMVFLKELLIIMKIILITHIILIHYH